MALDSLLNICLEHIQDEYYYGDFGTFKLIIDSSNGYFNASKLCKSGGKKFRCWLETKRSQNLLYSLKQKESSLNDFDVLYQVKGKRNEIGLLLRGTYVHKDLLLDIASWISHEFYLKAENIINNLYANKFMKRITKLESDVMTLETKNEKYKQMEEDISPKTEDILKQPQFVLMEIDDTYPLYAMRCQRKSKTSQIERLKRKYPNLKIVFELKYDPNAMNLFNRAKEQIKNMSTFRNKIQLLNGREQFIEELTKIAETKI